MDGERGGNAGGIDLILSAPDGKISVRGVMHPKQDSEVC